MNIENYIESQYRELLSCSQINVEYSDLYKSFRNQKLREILMTLHHDLVGLFRTMNERLPTGEHEAHFWAEPSRDLIRPCLKNKSCTRNQVMRSYEHETI